MSNIVFYGLIIVAIGAYFGYITWLKNSIQNRNFTTNATPDQVRALFDDKVAKAGWKIVDDGNPMVAQSSLAAGIRQQLRLVTNIDATGQTIVQVGPSRIVTKGWFLRVPAKAHTLRMRMNSFVKAVSTLDPAIEVNTSELVSH